MKSAEDWYFQFDEFPHLRCLDPEVNVNQNDILTIQIDALKEARNLASSTLADPWHKIDDLIVRLEALAPLK